jgi:type II secretory pathway component PulF
MIFEKRLTRHEKGLMFERMAMLISNGMSPQEVFRSLADEFKAASAKLEFCIGRVKNGESIVTAMNQVNLLSTSEYATLKAGETSGRLPQTLESLAEFTEIVENQISSAKKAIIPNIGYVIASIGVLYAMMLTIVPAIGGNVPANKRETFFVFKMSDAVIHFHNNYALYAAGLIAVLVIIAVQKASTQKGKDQITDMMLNTPIIKEGVMTFNLAMWARQTSMMIQSGVSFQDVISLTANTLPTQIRQGMNSILKDVSNIGWQNALNKKNWPENDKRRNWPPEVFGALRSGGDTGHLDVTLGKLSKSLEKTSGRLINKSTKTIGFITFIIAVLSVAFVLISVITATMSGISK